ncbi:MAG TPA: hypothetical protein VF951_04415 [Streptosporangiaceae bacterium]
MSVDAWHHDVPPGPVPHLAQLRLLVADAADRAAKMLAGAYLAVEVDDPLVDAVRILATAEGASHIAQAARLTGRPEEELRRLVLAYRHGGACGVSATVEASAGGPDQMADAVREVQKRRALAIGDLVAGPGIIIDPGAGVQIRLGPDDRWYPFTSGQDRWWPAPGATESPGAAYQAALRARSLRRVGG